MRRVYILTAATAALAQACPMAAHAQSGPVAVQPRRLDIAPHVREAAQRFGIPEDWIYAVIRAESAGDTRAVSVAGALGLMQLMPGTWARQRARFSLGVDPFDPRDNILAGTSYLRQMYDTYGAQGFLAAYNAGPGRYEDWLAGKRALPSETRRYAALIASRLRSDRTLAAVVLQPVTPAASSSPSPTNTDSLSVAGSTFAPTANPFARPERARHDLFAAVSMVIGK